ncbi:MAG TPA: SRPBCC family protein [Chthoniobacteraceae bacterium]|jgi:uncharacterized membrane protein|nr:SRPBCC family protein [Chthoniobacteraceae bacterium]
MSQFTSLERSVIVSAPLHVAYEAWNRFEEFPEFMEGVVAMERLDEKRFVLKSESGGQVYESICERVLTIPNRRLAWRTVEGPDSSGVVCFGETGSGQVEVTLKMRYNPKDGWQDEKEVTARLERNLQRFKARVESGAAHAKKGVRSAPAR